MSERDTSIHRLLVAYASFLCPAARIKVSTLTAIHCHDDVERTNCTQQGIVGASLGTIWC